jgi:hypothetical protein
VVPDFAHLLPTEIQPFTRSIVDADHLSFLQGSGHGGSHPQLVHEFVRALVESRDPWPNAATSANWTCVGILAHESAVHGGEIRWLPEFTFTRSDSKPSVGAAHAGGPPAPHIEVGARRQAVGR